MRVTVVIAAALVLAGCGGTASSLDDSAEATAAETSRVEMTYEFGALGEEKASEFAAVGEFDFPNERGAMEISGSFPIFGDEIVMKEFRLLGSTSYLRWTHKGRTFWVKDENAETSGDPAELLFPFPGSPTKPTDVLARALMASEKTEELGRDVLRGEETTHYRLRVDLQKLVKQLPPADRPEGDIESLWGARVVPVEIWIDDESRLRRITITREADEDNEVPETSTTVELFDYGVEVDVEPPPSDELISDEEFDKLLQSELELEAESGEGSSVPLEEIEKICETAREELPKKEADRVCQDLKENP